MKLHVHHLGVKAYEDVWRDMQSFTENRTPETEDEIWLVQHPPVYTLGKNGKAEHILDSENIPVVHVDRGGQVTYHGPGQIVVYVLLDLNRLNQGVRSLVSTLEKSVIELLSQHSIEANALRDAPGVYVDQCKIAALGLRIKKGCCFHGLALNVDMDLEPYERINPCGYKDLKITQFSNLVESVEIHEIEQQFLSLLIKNLKYTEFTESYEYI